MGRMKVHESELRRHIRSWPQHEQGLISFIEPGLGADTGFPDTTFLIGAYQVPIELKRGRSVVKELRPSQRAWHRATLHAGGITYGITLLNDGSVLMVRLALSGGLMSELQEHAMDRWETLAEMEYSHIKELISAYSC